MPRKSQGWITFQASEEEQQILTAFCERSQRTKTEVLRELIRTLNAPQAIVTGPAMPQVLPTQAEAIPKRPLKMSSRNLLKGRVKRVVAGSVNSEITLEIVHQVELISIITRASVDELGLTEGQEAYAVIKSNDVAIALD